MAKIYTSLSTKVSKETGRSEILIRLQNGRAVNTRAHSRIFILPKFFDTTAGDIVIKVRKLTPEVKEITRCKGQLERLKAHILESAQKVPATATAGEWLQETIDRYVFPEKYIVKKPDIEFFEAIEKYTTEHKLSSGRLRHYHVLSRALQRWELYTNRTLDLNSITTEDLENFREFITNEHKLFHEDKKGKVVPKPEYKKVCELMPETRIAPMRGDNYISGIFKRFRAMWKWFIDQNLTTNDPFLKFKVGSEIYGTPIYISIDERDQIAAAKMPTNSLEVQRDIFIFQCFIGCRVGDLYAMTQDNITKDRRGLAIEYVPMKTKDENPSSVKVYLTEQATVLFEKYNDHDRQSIFPFISQQRYNDAIKEIFHAAGIERMVTVRNSITGENEQRSIAEVASSHLARRTFVGNLYKQVKDPSLVGKLSGHKDGSRAFARYRDIDDDMVKEMTDLLGGKHQTITYKQKREIVLRKTNTKEELMKKQIEIQQLLNSGIMSMEEYIDIQSE